MMVEHTAQAAASPSLEIFKTLLDKVSTTCFSFEDRSALSSGLAQAISKGPFKPKLVCDSVIHESSPQRKGKYDSHSARKQKNWSLNTQRPKSLF